MMRSKFVMGLCIALLLVAALFGLTNLDPASAAPRAAPTPVAVDATGAQPSLVTLFDSQVITADTRGGCTPSSNFERADVQYEFDQTAVNTTTLYLQFTNETPGQAGTSYINGVAVVSANAADATNMQQLQVFGAWVCAYADVTNANPVTLTAKALLK